MANIGHSKTATPIYVREALDKNIGIGRGIAMCKKGLLSNSLWLAQE